MARAINKLSARTVQTISKPGRHGDGGGLYLVVDPSGARRWLFLFRWQGKLKEMGLGGVVSVSLAEARVKAEDARRTVASGQNPIDARRSAEAREAEATTFGAFADALIDDLKAGFRNEKHGQQWTNTLATYAADLRPKPIADIGTDDVLKVLKPIWLAKAETASRVRGRIERVLDAAKAKGLREGENPARWRGHLDHLLPRRQKLQRGHHAAMPYADVPAFLDRVRASEAMAARALELTILTAARSGETRNAKWDEFDLSAGLWTVPAARMKAGKEHRVPLPARAIEMLTPLKEGRVGDLVFPGAKKGHPLSVMAMDMLLRRMKADVTVHGFRSAFRDWCGNETSFPREVAEQALAHHVGDAVERAYRRSDALLKRRRLMEAWASFCEPAKIGNVVSLTQSRPA